ncbi:MAG: acetyltransferase [Gammaproteobacteria bacterium]|nr:acetyltransferase [Gammaproteobacteria bacterium]
MQDLVVVADAVRDACVEAALNAYEDAGISGLCAEGRWEIAIQTMRRLDVHALVVKVAEQSARPRSP